MKKETSDWFYPLIFLLIAGVLSYITMKLNLMILLVFVATTLFFVGLGKYYIYINIIN